MSRLSKVFTIIIIMLLLFSKSVLSHKVLYQATIEPPIQIDIEEKKEIKHFGRKGDVKLFLRANYELKGVVKSKRKYSDFPSQISYYDLAIAWGDLNKKGIDDFISYSQRGRWYYFQHTAASPVDIGYISNNSANVHIIHKNENVLNKIKKIKKGDLIKLKGYLVDVDFKESNNVELWQTSRSRSDTGNGACEIFYVEEATILD